MTVNKQQNRTGKQEVKNEKGEEPTRLLRSPKILQIIVIIIIWMVRWPLWCFKELTQADVADGHVWISILACVVPLILGMFIVGVWCTRIEACDSRVRFMLFGVRVHTSVVPEMMDAHMFVPVIETSTVAIMSLVFSCLMLGS